MTYFGIFAPWVRPYREVEATPSVAARIGTIVAVCLCLFIVLGVRYFARRNVAHGRGDTKGALRVAWGVALAAVVAWAWHAHHVTSATDEVALFFNGMAASLMAGFATWCLYISLEPFVRKRRPQLLISWSRLLTGQYRDPLVGRDQLAGGFGGALLVLALHVDNAIPYWSRFSGEAPLGIPRVALALSREVLGGLLSLALSAIVSSLVALTVFFLVLVIVRIEWVSVALTGLFILLTSLGGENLKLEFPMALVSSAIVLFLVVRLGVSALLFGQLLPIAYYQRLSGSTSRDGTSHAGCSYWQLYWWRGYGDYGWRWGDGRS